MNYPIIKYRWINLRNLTAKSNTCGFNFLNYFYFHRLFLNVINMCLMKLQINTYKDKVFGMRSMCVVVSILIKKSQLNSN